MSVNMQIKWRDSQKYCTKNICVSPSISKSIFPTSDCAPGHAQVTNTLAASGIQGDCVNGMMVAMLTLERCTAPQGKAPPRQRGTVIPAQEHSWFCLCSHTEKPCHHTCQQIYGAVREEMKVKWCECQALANTHIAVNSSRWLQQHSGFESCQLPAGNSATG